MEQIFVNVQTAEVVTAPMTPEEIASIQAVAAEWQASLPAKTRVYKADIWRRATDDEAAQIDAVLNSQPVRLRRMWNDTTFLSTADDLFPLIQAAAVGLFGQVRAHELLQPTE